MVEIETTLFLQKRKGDLPIPEALYSCGTRSCAEETSYLADMLFWSDKKRGWFCEHCFDADGDDRGISLAEEIERQKENV